MANLESGDHVTQKGTTNPVGVVEDIHGDFVTVRWGTADRRTFRDDFRYDQLEKVPYKVYSQREVEMRQAKEVGGILHEE